MTIDKEKLVEILVKKTGMDKKQVEDHLYKLVDRIQQAAKEGKDFEIEKFGTFSVRNDTLHFEPADSLETEINHKYAGMKPIELIGAFKEIPETEEEEEDTEDKPTSIFGLDEDDTEEDIVEETEKETAESPAEEHETATEETQEETQPDEEKEEGREAEPDVPRTSQKKATFEFDEGVPEEVSEAEKEPRETEATGEQIAASTGQEEETLEKQAPGEVSREEEKLEEDPIGKVLIAAVAVIVLGVSGWFLYEIGILGTVQTEGGESKPVSTEQVEQTANREAGQQESPPASTDQPGENAVNAGESAEQKSEEEVSNIVDVAEQSKKSIYGLRGGAVPKADEGYTIVVYSLQNKDKAEQLNNEFQSKGFITVFSRATVGGDIFWRVGLGQFKTVEEANGAITELPEPYSANNFIRKIQ